MLVRSIFSILLLAFTASAFRLQSSSSRGLHKSSLKMYEASIVDKKAQIPLKIAVAGGGVGGVMLGYALQLKGFDVTVFEKAKKFSRFG